MSSIEKIKKLREIYITQKGKEPKSVILGRVVIEEMKKDLSLRYLDSGVEIYGMRIFIDYDKPSRVEVGNIV